VTASPHRLKQVETYLTPTEAIMRDPNFLRGVAEVREGRPFNPNGGVGSECTIGANDERRLINAQWNYERGRLFGACTNLPVLLDDGSLNSLAVAVFRTAYSRNLIL
jgi:hypothetical protein